MAKEIKCPKCQSEDVGYVGISSGVGNGLKPIVNSHQHQCHQCGTRFQVKGTKK